MDLGAYIKKLIQNKGQSIKSLSERMMIDRGTFYQVLRNGRIPTAVFVDRLSLCLDLAPEEEEALLRYVCQARIGEGEYTLMEGILNFLHTLNRLEADAGGHGIGLRETPPLPASGFAANREQAERLMMDFCTAALRRGSLDAFTSSGSMSKFIAILDDFCGRADIRHLFVRDREPVTLMDALAHMLNTVCAGVNYAPAYCVSQMSGSASSWFRNCAYPYYMVSGEDVLLLGATGENAFFLRNPTMAAQLRQLFDEAFTRSRKLLTTLSQRDELLAHMRRLREDGLGSDYYRIMSRLPVGGLIGTTPAADAPLAAYRNEPGEELLGKGILLLDADALTQFCRTGECDAWGERVCCEDIGERMRCLAQFRQWAAERRVYFLRRGRICYTSHIDVLSGDAELVFCVAGADGGGTQSHIVRDPDIVAVWRRFFGHALRGELALTAEETDAQIGRAIQALQDGCGTNQDSNEEKNNFRRIEATHTYVV